MSSGYILKMIVGNSVAWLFFHMTISILGMRISDSFLDKHKKWFVLASWEKEGRIWQDWLKIRSWKELVPDSSSFMKTTYNQKDLVSSDDEILELFIRETRRAELVHWISILPAGLFFIWNPPWAGWFMVLYAVLANIPFILIQRYNRPRIERVYKSSKKRKKKSIKFKK